MTCGPINLLQRSAVLCVAACLAVAATPAFGQEAAYPTKPIRIVIGLAAGGGIDVITRVVAQKLSDQLGQQVLVDNKAGASGIIAAEFVMKAPPDGYTLMMAPSGPMVYNPIMFSKLPYSPLKDFVPIGMVASFPLIAVVNVATPVKTMKELIDYAKANPAKANYAASTAAFQLTTELLNMQSGANLVNITYKGTNESVAAVLGGDVLMTIADSGPASAALRGGKVRGLAVTAKQRMAAFPDLPTVMEAGFPELETTLWGGLFAPVGTPPAIVKKLEQEVARAVRSADVRERFNTLTVNPVGGTGEELAQTIATEIARWGAVAKKSNIKPNN